MTNGKRADQLIRDGHPIGVICRTLGISHRYVYAIKQCGGYDQWLKMKRELYDDSARQMGIPRGRHSNSRVRKYNYDHSSVLAAVDSGLSYGQAAKKFGITRNVVAGIMNRRPESKGPPA